MASVKTAGTAQNSWLVRFSRTNEQTISVVFSRGKEVNEIKNKLMFIIKACLDILL